MRFGKKGGFMTDARRLIWVPVILILLILLLLARLSTLLVDWLWLEELGYGIVFWRLLAIRTGLALGVWLAVFGYLWVNLRIGLGLLPVGQGEEGGKVIQLHTGKRLALPRPWLRLGALLAAAVAALFPAAAAMGEWNTWMRFQWRRHFGAADPLYGNDLGFYLFQLPFWELLQNGLAGVAFVVFAALLAWYLYFSVVIQGQPPLDRRSFGHLTVAFLVFLAGYAWGYFLDRYQLLFDASGVVHGAGYTQVTVVRYGLWVMIGAAVLLAVAVLAGYRRRRPRLSIAAAAGFLAFLVIVMLLVPLAVQKFLVEPNELELESPYIEREIAFTRAAYGLNRVREVAYPALTDLTYERVLSNEQTLRNIRLWDWRPLRQSFRQLQEIRLYYQFYEIDTDRYPLEDEYRQVMLSARELAAELPERADTWVNRHLQFTHGYGLAMTLAAQEGAEGTPTFLIQDLPPVTRRGLEISEPAIYFGERMPGYRIVNTGVQELDYPAGDENVYTHYAGRGGIPLDGFWKKLLFAWEYGQINILLSDYITPESRIQIRRQVQQRIHGIAPFLVLDADPYLVLSEGRLFWIQDAYTVSDRYPYSDPYQGRFNYIRNSVKIIVDAFHGTVDFYVMDPRDPVLGVYRDALPGLFRPLEELPAGLRAHLRYPEDLFRVQVSKYNRYHMTIPQVFYNNEDLWTLPSEKYAGDPILMDPYYILMRLPDEERLEYLLMQPLTPDRRNNMIAWMAVRCDFPGYGELVVYKLPKEKLILGPMQVEALIDQDAVISQQLSLWDQRGSRVIRGNLLAVPMDHSFLYVEPVYLIAEEMNIPQLRRVIVVYNERVVMEPTLEQAVAAVFGAAPAPAPTEVRPAGPPVPADVSRARETFRRAEEALRGGDWEAFGEAMRELQEVLGRE